ncbi:hypothetical protein MNV49_001144 [Pseudohyphozyma bogoriensis]|nr:hypothetical protein MNV49_001144 [Pseudohyphozyma bogoriensis]
MVAAGDGTAETSGIPSLRSAMLVSLLDAVPTSELQTLADQIVYDRQREDAERVLFRLFPSLQHSGELIYCKSDGYSVSIHDLSARIKTGCRVYHFRTPAEDSPTEVRFEWSYGKASDNRGSHLDILITAFITRAGKQLSKFQLKKYRSSGHYDDRDYDSNRRDGAQDGTRDFFQKLAGVMDLDGLKGKTLGREDRKKLVVEILRAFLPEHLLAFQAEFLAFGDECEVRVDNVISRFACGSKYYRPILHTLRPRTPPPTALHLTATLGAHELSLAYTSFSVFLNTYTTEDLLALSNRLVADRVRQEAERVLHNKYFILRGSAELLYAKEDHRILKAEGGVASRGSGERIYLFAGGATELKLGWEHSDLTANGTWDGGWSEQGSLSLLVTMSYSDGQDTLRMKVKGYHGDDCGRELGDGKAQGVIKFLTAVTRLLTDGGGRIQAGREATVGLEAFRALVPDTLLAFKTCYQGKPNEERHTEIEELEKFLARIALNQDYAATVDEEFKDTPEPTEEEWFTAAITGRRL